MDERILIRRAVEGDEDAFRVLYDDHVDRVFRLSYRMTGDEDVARECTQEAFIRAYRSLGRFQGGSRFSTWIHSIATNVTLNRLRKRKRQAPRELPLDEMEPAGASRADRNDPTVRDRIRVAVDGLPEIYRTVFLMHDLEGFKHPEIAGVLDIAVGTSKARLSRARAALRTALGDEMREYVS